jgi:hypothetical protein
MSYFDRTSRLEGLGGSAPDAVSYDVFSQQGRTALFSTQTFIKGKPLP